MLDEFTTALRALVEVESPSAEPTAVRQCADLVAELGDQITGLGAERLSGRDGTPAVVFRGGDPLAGGRVLLLGHLDTVWPLGTTAVRPFTVTGGRATGPGVFDMKAGLVIGLFAMARLGRDVPVTFLVTGDEEIGSVASRPLIERLAREAQAVLVLEGAAAGGALKRARKGWSLYTLRFRGRAAHAGLEPDAGRNALIRMAEVVTGVLPLNDRTSGLTVTPTLAAAGQTVNTVPDRAELSLDVRAASVADQRRIDAVIRGLAGDRHGVLATVEGGENRPPMEEHAARVLLDRIAALAETAGRPVPDSAAVGGVSDANICAAIGVPTLDGLGAVGGAPHAEEEWVDLEPTLRRVSLLTDLVTDLIDRPL